MKYMRLFRMAAMILIFIGGPVATCEALTLDYFASVSKLASGKWVKVAIAEDGIYELTDAELQAMGFGAPEKVRIFGHGGYMQPETFGRNYIDDLRQIPTLRIQGKTIFYGRGVTEMSAKTSGSTLPYYTGKVNIYATRGYYFLTDNEAYAEMPIPTVATTELGANHLNTSYDYYYHNKESRCWARSGKLFLGEDLRNGGKLNFTFDVPNIIPGETAMVSVAAGADVDDNSQLLAVVNGTSVTFNMGSNVIAPVDGQILFNYTSPTGSVRAQYPEDKVNFEVQLEDKGINDGALDYFVFSYKHRNEIPKDSSQVRMGFYKPQSADAIIVPTGNENLHVWNVTTPQSPSEYTIMTSGEESGFTPDASVIWGQYVMFDASKELKKVLSSEDIANQNLHSIGANNMIIICPEAFKGQAERIADLHRRHDGMSVVVADQEHIFNEYSSGKPDCAAYRAFIKMIYDRNSTVTKYVLLFGTGSYDNRGLGGKKSPYQLLTYQSENSNSEVASFVTDDYFGFMDDASGNSIPSDYLRLSVGRIPAGTVDEARAAADKIINYVENDDSGEWHGKSLMIADQGDENMHMFQAEGARIAIDEATDSTMYVGKVYVGWYPYNANGESVAGRERIADYMKNGVLLASYVGHANYTYFTNSRKLWRSTDAANEDFAHAPFYSIAACNTARFDSDDRGIVEEMMDNTHGGAIGVMASARTVYSTQNDKLNVAFIKNMLSLDGKGEYTTVGDAYKAAKMIFAPEYNVNKMSFILFGDPAMKVRYPLQYGKITEVNGLIIGTDDISVSPMTSVNVKGVINTKDGLIDKNFNGEVTVTLYDKRELYSWLKDRYSSSAPQRDSYYPRERLSETKGVVTNGEYEVQIMVPRYCKAQGDSCMLRAFAKSDGEKMVAASTEALKIAPLDEKVALTDTESPIIERLQIGESGDGVVDPSPNVYISVSDNMGIDVRAFSMNNGMKLTLDGGAKNITSVTDYFTLSDGGKNGNATIKLQNLTPGRHTLEYTVNDLAGNQSVRTEEFFVGGRNVEGTLALAKDATRDNVEMVLNTTDGTIVAARYYIIDGIGNVVKAYDSSENTWTWNLKDADGNRVVAGKYKCYTTFTTNDKATGATAPQTIVVLGE